jgi:PIN domain nuclease of toxin-antitoxin system
VEAVIHLDTHVVVWLYAGDLSRFPVVARRRIEREELRISPIVALELEYLYEIGRVSEGASEVLPDLARRLGLAQAEGDFAAVVTAARGLTWTRDPFDRLIVGHAVTGGTSLLTKDRTIRQHYRHAIWG